MLCPNVLSKAELRLSSPSSSAHHLFVEDCIRDFLLPKYLKCKPDSSKVSKLILQLGCWVGGGNETLMLHAEPSRGRNHGIAPDIVNRDTEKENFHDARSEFLKIIILYA